MQQSSRREIFQTLIALAVPAILEQMLSTLVQYVDTAMVGRLGLSAGRRSGQLRIPERPC